jgi:hypothetical protein
MPADVYISDVKSRTIMLTQDTAKSPITKKIFCLQMPSPKKNYTHSFKWHIAQHISKAVERITA